MPQLNPTPWFLVMLTAWLTLNLMLALINNMTPTNNPTVIKTNHQTKQMNTWSWPW